MVWNLRSEESLPNYVCNTPPAASMAFSLLLSSTHGGPCSLFLYPSLSLATSQRTSVHEGEHAAIRGGGEPSMLGREVQAVDG